MADGSAQRHRLAPNIIAGVVLALLAAVVLVWQQPWNGNATAARPVVGAHAAAVIARQINALDSATTVEAFQRAAGPTPAARAWAARTYANLHVLAVTDLRLRFVSGGEPNVRADGATDATVDLSWHAGERSGLAREAQSSVTLILDPLTGGNFAVRGAAADNAALPLWLVGTLGVEQRGGTTVISVDGGNPRQPIGAYAARARAAVRAVVGRTAVGVTPLVVVSPRTQAQAAEILHRSESEIKQIAAVTTALDATRTVAIVLNPAVFAMMDGRAAQIVMSHEATHLMTGATRADMDTWVSEGFADFVALRADRAPLRVSAGQILRRVKAGGAPAQLPTAADFGATRRGLGGVYESAWMAFRMLAADHGDRAVLSFYNDVRAGTPTDRAARAAFGLTVDALTRQWRAYLTKSASITS